MENEIKDLITTYLKELDNSLLKLSNKQEGKLLNLPSWVLTNRKIRIGYSEKICSLKVEPNDKNSLKIIYLNDQNEFLNFIAPLQIRTDFENPPKKLCFQLGDMELISKSDSVKKSRYLHEGLIGVFSLDSFKERFSEDQAKKHAIEYWNICINNLSKKGNFITQCNKMFKRLERISTHENFVERNIHRYINEYNHILLPSHKKCYFEHPLFLNSKKKVADFILERESGLKPMLIELESPKVQAFRKSDKESTSKTNHAKNQIAEWVKFIDSNPLNTQGDMSFLTGPKDRLVIIGHGLKYEHQMDESKFTDTTIWTYTKLIKEMKDVWNNHMRSQAKFLDMENPELL